MNSLADNLWRRLKGYKQELLNLKKSRRTSSNSRYYIYKVDGDTFYSSWRITFKNGNQPIITEVLSYYNTSLSAPSGNTQYIFSFSQASAQLTVFSTREIISVVGIS